MLEPFKVAQIWEAPREDMLETQDQVGRENNAEGFFLLALLLSDVQFVSSIAHTLKIVPTNTRWQFAQALSSTRCRNTRKRSRTA